MTARRPDFKVVAAEAENTVPTVPAVFDTSVEVFPVHLFSTRISLLTASRIRAAKGDSTAGETGARGRTVSGTMTGPDMAFPSPCHEPPTTAGESTFDSGCPAAAGPAGVST